MNETSKNSLLPALESLGEQDIHLFREGTHARLYNKLGCQRHEGGAHFAVWAPNAKAVSVIGDFNGWQAQAHPAQPRWDSSGIWEADIAGVEKGQRYKFVIHTRDGERMEKADPFARHAEPRRGRSTKCIWARGGAAPTVRCSTTARWRTSWPSTCRA
jgi:1,4-alpha-glucan branching enzyme